MKDQSQKGFMLLEIMISIAIIAVLTAVGGYYASRDNSGSGKTSVQLIQEGGNLTEQAEKLKQEIEKRNGEVGKQIENLP